MRRVFFLRQFRAKFLWIALFVCAFSKPAVATPDLELSRFFLEGSINGSVPTWQAGQAHEVIYTANNLGTSETGVFEIGVYLSTDPFITTADTVLFSFLSDSIGPGESRSWSFPVRLPLDSNLRAGGYVVGVLLDSGQDTAELNENNNQVSGSINFVSSFSPPDIAGLDITISDSLVAPGQKAIVSGQIQNVGPGVINDWRYSAFLSEDRELDLEEDYQIATFLQSFALAIEGEQLAFNNLVAEIPLDVPEGTYFLLVYGTGGTGPESSWAADPDPSNNVASRLDQITVDVDEAPVANLGITEIAAEKTASSDREFSACSFKIANLGPNGVIEEDLVVSFSLSSDSVFGDADDVRIGQIELTRSIPANTTADALELTSDELVQMAAEFPSNLSNGSYFLFAGVKIEDGIPSDSDSDNDYGRTAGRFQFTQEDSGVGDGDGDGDTGQDRDGLSEDRHPNSLDGATRIGPDGEATGTLTFRDDDFFSIIVPGPGTLEIRTEGSADTYGFLLDSEGNQLAGNDDGGTSTNFLITYEIEVEERATYYVRVRGAGYSAAGDYTLVSDFLPEDGFRLNGLFYFFPAPHVGYVYSWQEDKYYWFDDTQDPPLARVNLTSPPERGVLLDAKGWYHFKWPVGYSFEEGDWYWYRPGRQFVRDLSEGRWLRLDW